MHHLIIVHRAYQDAGEKNNLNFSSWPEHAKIWRTCRREIVFLNDEQLSVLKLEPKDEIYFDWEAEEFLVQVLCGLKSPLVGETEVFGQFKLWWNELQKDDFKVRLQARVQVIYNVVKKVREESLNGLGSQSYGSYFRKKLNQLKAENRFNSEIDAIDFIGSGQLVSEMLPWIRKENKYRLWVRDPQKVRSNTEFSDSLSVRQIEELKRTQIKILVVAAPISHEYLNDLLTLSLEKIHLIDLRSDSMNFDTHQMTASHLNLNDFVFVVENSKDTVRTQIENALKQISRWKHDEVNKAQIRPFGWDDL